jgi:hypothetical protein
MKKKKKEEEEEEDENKRMEKISSFLRFFPPFCGSFLLPPLRRADLLDSYVSAQVENTIRKIESPNVQRLQAASTKGSVL